MLLPMVEMSLVAGEPMRPISRKEYDRLVELGFFEREHIELIEGVLVQLSPQGMHHVKMVEWLNNKLVRLIDPSYAVRPGCPFAASDWSEPEPDFTIIRETPGVPDDHPSEVLLLIEVSNTSLRYDRGAKLKVYAKAGIPEYWIIDVNTMTVEVYTEPRDGRFANKQVLRDGDVLRATLVPGVEIPVADLPR
jgi:Uma2 family endonuclease